MSKPKKTSKDLDLNDFIRKSHIKAVEKFNEELKAFARETGEEPARLYEDAFTSFTLSDLRVENGFLRYRYDGSADQDRVVFFDDESGKHYETDYDGIMDNIKFWRKCLNRAKRYWAMDSEKLDAIQNGEVEDEEGEED